MRRHVSPIASLVLYTTQSFLQSGSLMQVSNRKISITITNLEAWRWRRPEPRPRPISKVTKKGTLLYVNLILKMVKHTLCLYMYMYVIKMLKCNQMLKHVLCLHQMLKRILCLCNQMLKHLWIIVYVRLMA